MWRTRLISGFYLNAIQELLRLILAVRLLVCPALAFDVLWAHTLRTGLEKQPHSVSHPFIRHPLPHLPLQSPPAPSPIQASKRCFTRTLKGGDGDTLFTLQKTGYCVNSALRGDIQMTVKRDVLIKISSFFNGKKKITVSFVSASEAWSPGAVVTQPCSVKFSCCWYKICLWNLYSSLGTLTSFNLACCQSLAQSICGWLIRVWSWRITPTGWWLPYHWISCSYGSLKQVSAFGYRQPFQRASRLGERGGWQKGKNRKTSRLVFLPPPGPPTPLRDMKSLAEEKKNKENKQNKDTTASDGAFCERCPPPLFFKWSALHLAMYPSNSHRCLFSELH